MTLTVDFDCRTIPDDALETFRRLATTHILDGRFAAPKFACWLRNWLETEASWRETDPDHRPAKHAIALPPVHEWSDRELGRAMLAAVAIQQMTIPDSFGVFVDRLVMALAGRVCQRLGAR